jgi:CBS domain-containing protein
MKTYLVKNIMVPLAEYTTIAEDARLSEAVVMLQRAKRHSASERSMHRAILVLDKNQNVVGKLSQLDLILGLEEGYRRIGDLKKVSHSGYDPKFIRSMIEKNRMWEKPLDELCLKAGRIKVKDIMYSPSKGEYVDIAATLDIAIHQLGLGRHQSLLVTEKGRVVGIIRLSDIFEVVHEAVGQCNIQTDEEAA